MASLVHAPTVHPGPGTKDNADRAEQCANGDCAHAHNARRFAPAA